MKKVITKNKYSELSGQFSRIARVCACSPDYVKVLLGGSRTIKTNRAVKAQKVFQKADQLLEFYTNN